MTRTGTVTRCTSPRRWGVTLVSPLLADQSRQGKADAGYDRASFTIDFDTEGVRCPQGQTSTWCNRVTQRGTDAIVTKFAAGTCQPCPRHCPRRRAVPSLLTRAALGHSPGPPVGPVVALGHQNRIMQKISRSVGLTGRIIAFLGAFLLALAGVSLELAAPAQAAPLQPSASQFGKVTTEAMATAPTFISGYQLHCSQEMANEQITGAEADFVVSHYFLSTIYQDKPTPPGPAWRYNGPGLNLNGQCVTAFRTYEFMSTAPSP